MKINVREVYEGANAFTYDEYSENPRKQYGKLKIVYKYNKKDKIWVTQHVTNTTPILLLKGGYRVEMRTQRNGKNEIWPNLSIGSPFGFNFLHGGYDVSGNNYVTLSPAQNNELQPFKPRIFPVKMYDQVSWAKTITENVDLDPKGPQFMGFNNYTIGDTSNLDDDCSIVFYIDYL